MATKLTTFRTGYNYNTDEVSRETSLECTDDENMTQQQFKEDSDINTIVRRFGLTGELPDDFKMPQSGDFTGVNDFHAAMNTVRAAEEEFMRVPAELRARFNNDPGRLMQFLDDDKNRDEAQKLGLLKPPPETTRTAINAIDELRATMTAPDVPATKGKQ